MELLDGADAEAPDRRQAAAVEDVLDLGDPDRRRARRRARAGHHPPRHQARQHLRHHARAGQDPGLRPGEADAGDAGGAGRRRRGQRSADDRTLTEPGDRGRHGRLHVARAGARRGARRAHRPVLVRRGALRNGRPGRKAFTGSTTAVIFHAILNRAPLPALRINPLMPARTRRHHRQGAREGPAPAIQQRGRYARRPEADEAGPGSGRVGSAVATGRGQPAGATRWLAARYVVAGGCGGGGGNGNRRWHGGVP